MTVNLNLMSLSQMGMNKVIKIVYIHLKGRGARYRLINMILITIRVIKRGEEGQKDLKIKKLF